MNLIVIKLIKKIKIKRKTISTTILGILFLLSSIYITDFSVLSFNVEEISSKLFSEYTTHDPILIDSSDDFITYGFLGTGDLSSPYLIANYSITNGVDYSIEIKNVDDYFIIENCYTEGSTYGIILYNINTGRAIIRNNTNYNHYHGINIETSAQTQVVNNSVSECIYGIQIDFSAESVVQDNICTNNIYGVSSFWSEQTNLSNNTCQDNQVGIYLTTIYLTTISKNTLINNGLYVDFESIDDYSSLTFSDNTVNGLPISIIYNDVDTTIDSSLYGQIILLNCSGITVSNPLPITTINYGVHLFFSNSCIVQDTVQMNNYYGILAYNSPDAQISDNNCNNNYYELDELNKRGSGIQAEHSNNTIIKDNICINYGEGVSIIRSFNVDILGNTCDDNDDGIGVYSQDVNIKQNVLDSNTKGMWIMGSPSFTTSNLLIESNTITGSLFYGIDLRSYTANNIIHHNYLIDNGGITSQARDDGTNNIWYDTSTNQGNYWSDLSGSGSYSIDGSAGSVDPYPLSSVSEFSLIPAFLFAFLVFCTAIVPIIKKRK